MLLIKLSSRFKITVTTVMYWNEEKQQFTEIIKLKRVRKSNHKDVVKSQCFGKRNLVMELMAWLKG